MQLRIDIPPQPDYPPDVSPYTIGTPLNPRSPIKLPYPIKLVPRHKKSYFVPLQSFNIVQMFQNPMMLMMVFGGLMMLAMPYITVTIPILLLPSPMKLRWYHDRKTLIPRCCRKHNRTKQKSRMLFKVATSNLGMYSVCIFVKIGKFDRRHKNSSISALAGGDDVRPPTTTATQPGLSNNSIKSRGKKRRN